MNFVKLTGYSNAERHRSDQFLCFELLSTHQTTYNFLIFHLVISMEIIIPIKMISHIDNLFR